MAGAPVNRASSALQLALCTGVAVAAMAGLAGSAYARAEPARSGGQPFTLASLASLGDYTFQVVTRSGRYSFEVSGAVHSATDWVVSSKAPAVTTYDVGGQGWARALGRVSRVHLRTRQGWSHLDGERTYAEGMVGLTHVSGMRLVRAGTCTGAGRAGTSYRFELPGADRGLFDLLASACVADRGGALLFYSQGVAGGKLAGAVHLSGDSYTFRVTSIGHVPAVTVPRPATTTTVLPALPKPVGKLPPGFPRALPAPPGQVVSSARMAAGKWYVLLSEGGDGSALARYAAALQRDGFSVTSRTTAAGIELESLASKAYDVQLELLALPGEGDQMSVVVGLAGP